MVGRCRQGDVKENTLIRSHTPELASDASLVLYLRFIFCSVLSANANVLLAAIRAGDSFVFTFLSRDVNWTVLPVNEHGRTSRQPPTSGSSARR